MLAVVPPYLADMRWCPFTEGYLRLMEVAGLERLRHCHDGTISLS